MDLESGSRTMSSASNSFSMPIDLAAWKANSKFFSVTKSSHQSLSRLLTRFEGSTGVLRSEGQGVELGDRVGREMVNEGTKSGS